MKNVHTLFIQIIEQKEYSEQKITKRYKTIWEREAQEWHTKSYASLGGEMHFIELQRDLMDEAKECTINSSHY